MIKVSEMQSLTSSKKYTRKILIKAQTEPCVDYRAKFPSVPQYQEIHLTEEVWQVLAKFIKLNSASIDIKVRSGAILGVIGYTTDNWISNHSHINVKNEMKLAGMLDLDFDDLMTTLRRLVLYSYINGGFIWICKI